MAAPVEAFAGKWEIKTDGDPDAFMAAIGFGWLRRKAIGAALALGFGMRPYTITVDKGGDGTYKITIEDGKRNNVILTDGSEFTYEGPDGPANSTAEIDGNKVVMYSKNEDPPVTVVTERWINDADEYIIQLTCKEVPDAKWVRICKRIE